MRAVRLGDLRELLESTDFAAWWTEWQRASAALREARDRREDLLAQAELMAARMDLAQRAAADAFSRSGEAEDEGTRWSAGAQEEENRALALVGAHEERRARADDLRARLGAAERALEERRAAASGGRAGAGDPHEGAPGEAERQRASLAVEHGAAEAERRRLWDEVEAAWAGAFERSLLGAEHAAVARSVRREAERLFAEAEERRGRARQLTADAEAAARAVGEVEARLDALRVVARDAFGCVAGPAFLYWRHAEDDRSAFAVALADAPEGAGAQVKALQVHVVGRQGGVAHLEVAR
jgi:chromosome segregation ATPase